jgi:hypothetical protein
MFVTICISLKHICNIGINKYNLVAIQEIKICYNKYPNIFTNKLKYMFEG